MAGLGRVLRIRRRKEPTSSAPTFAAAALPRAPVVPHHWLTIAVVRPAPAGSIPVAQARIVVRPFPRGAARPEDPVARGTTGDDGTFAVSLPPGRYAVYAQHESDGKAVTVTLEHAGRATLVLESLARRATLTIEAHGIDGLPLQARDIEIRALPAGTHAARATTDDDGTARVSLPPGAYEVRVAGAVARTFLEAATTIRVTAEPSLTGAPARTSEYARRAGAAASDALPMELAGLREERWN